MKLKKILGLTGVTLAATAFLVACGSSKSSTADSSATSTKKTKIYLGTNASPKPFNYEDEDGQLTGYEFEVVKAVFEGLDQYELEYEVTEWSSVFAGLDSDRYQLAVNNISYTDERAEKYLYSFPTAANPLSMIVPKDSDIKGLDDIAGKSTEVVQGTTTATQLEKYNEENPDKPTTINFTKDSIQAILNRLNDGQHDYKLFEGIVAQTIADDQGLDNLKVIDLPADKRPLIYIIFADGQEELRDQVNARLKELEADGTLAKLSEKYLGGNYVPSADELVVPN
ncbi:amino acid ABC transporter substrate-binding protein [Streptococcus merionis]|uniref:ABC transporter substrate-binding lipoprotein n=1 Tax=Streptococcus merionis TaxID=400065 RepID=A0A239SUT7_9STRE|nr:amino acid ABC transporter substrate-binding protein [Streptococcus merionis]SNU89197.1 ABC transporter substrate-binding lipoprotein [Streptococcus merionis]